MDKRIYKVIENKKRELDSRIFFALAMNERNYSVGFGKKQNLYQYSNYIKKGLFLMKSIGPRNYDKILNLKKNGHQVSSWDEEGFVIFNDEFTKIRNDVRCLKEIDYLYTWGSEQNKNLQNVFPQFQKKIISTGHPRFDLLKKENRFFLEHDAQKIRDKYGKFILVVTKFGVGNAVMDWRTRDNKVFRSKHDISNEIFQKKTMESFIKTLISLSEKCPEINIIVRPHPAENISKWHEIFDNHKKIRVVYDYQNTCCWIAASQYIISTNCHTSMESYLLGKQSINFAPVQDKEVEFDIFKKVSHNIESPEELIEIVSNSIKNNFQLNLKNVEEDYLLKNISNLKINSFELMEETINDSLKQIENTNDKYTSHLNYLLFRFIKKIRNFKNNFLADKQLLTLSSQKIDFITLEEINEKVKKYDFKFNTKKIKISEKYPGIFIFEKID